MLKHSKIKSTLTTPPHSYCTGTIGSDMSHSGQSRPWRIKEDYPRPCLANCKTPQCAACLYAKATKRTWQTRAPPNRVTPVAVTNGPGDCVSVDQLISLVLGLIAQMRGWLMRKRYMAATIFVDHYSRLSYIHLQQRTKQDETLEAKRAFEAFARSHGVIIQHYHADNGQFAEAAFMGHCDRNHQTLTFCGANALFQNSIAEKRIQDLQDSARTMRTRQAPLATSYQRTPMAICTPHGKRCAHAHATTEREGTP